MARSAADRRRRAPVPSAAAAPDRARQTAPAPAVPWRVEAYPTARSLAAQRRPQPPHEYRIAPASPSAGRCLADPVGLTTRAQRGARSATPPASPPPTPPAAPLPRVLANRHATPASPTAPGWPARRSTATFMMPPTNSKSHQHPTAADAVGPVQKAHAQRPRECRAANGGRETRRGRGSAGGTRA